MSCANWCSGLVYGGESDGGSGKRNGRSGLSHVDFRNLSCATAPCAHKAFARRWRSRNTLVHRLRMEALRRIRTRHHNCLQHLGPFCNTFRGCATTTIKIQCEDERRRWCITIGFALLSRSLKVQKRYEEHAARESTRLQWV